MPAELDLGRRAHALLTRAMELEPAQRRPFVRGEGEGDAPLVERVLKLLDAADRSDRFLDQPALDPGLDPRLQIPDAVGDYLVVGVLGSGGMATVYEAIQDQPRRRVALKVMHQSVTHSEAYVRFRFETEALARLHHPGIAQIYETGAAQLGQPAPSPFFAMELVPGAVPITAYADKHRLSLRSRLVMLAAVCDAVHHGHQHGIIHRDLKPANVLVDGEGHAKVIDFGVARTTDAGADSPTAAMGVPQLIGTLNYMSPEQCGARREIDIRADVYSLGVMLYELVCGRMPYDLKGLPLPAALQAIAQQPARRPEIRHPRARDLEAIILKAIEKEPSRRYDSASALATDLRHFLSHQAIEARPPGVIDQCRLFAWRNRVLVGVGLAVLASAILVATLSTVFAVLVSKEASRRRVAEQRVTKELETARWQAYTAQIAGALSAMNTGEFQQMRTRLAEASYQPRGWEWGFLSRLAESSAGTITASDNMVMDMAVSDDWTRMVTAAAEGTIRLWDVGAGTRLAEFRSPSSARAMSIAFTSDGHYVITGDVDGVVRLLDATDLREVRVLGDLPGEARSVIGLPDRQVAAATTSGNAVLWSLDTREAVAFADDQPDGATGLALSEDGQLLATSNSRGDVWLRRTADLSVVHRLEFPGAVNQVRFSHDGRVGAAGEGGHLRVWSVADGKLLHSIKATQGVNTVRSLTFSHDGQLIVAGLVHRGILLVSSAGQVLAQIEGHTEAVSALSFRPDDQILMSASWDGTIRTWRRNELGSRSGMSTLKGHTNNVMELAFSPDGSMIASVSRDGSLRLWDPDIGELLATFNDGNGELTAVAFSPDGRFIASAGAGKGITIRDARTGAIAEQLFADAGGVASVAFDAAVRRLAAGGQDGSIRVWSLGKPEAELVIHAHEARTNSVVFSPDGSLIASGSRDRGVALWDAQSGARVAFWAKHQLDVFAVLFSKDGTRLYSGSRDQTIRVWDVRAKTETAVLAGHGQYVTSLALTEDETRLAAGSWFGEIVLYDVPTRDLIASFRAHESAIRGVAFSPDGRWLVSASYDATLRLFDSTDRAGSDAARHRALADRSEARRRVLPLLDQGHEPDAVMARLQAAGLDATTDPWVRKVVLSELAPKDEP